MAYSLLVSKRERRKEGAGRKGYLMANIKIDHYSSRA